MRKLLGGITIVIFTSSEFHDDKVLLLVRMEACKDECPSFFCSCAIIMWQNMPHRICFGNSFDCNHHSELLYSILGWERLIEL